MPFIVSVSVARQAYMQQKNFST